MIQCRLNGSRLIWIRLIWLVAALAPIAASGCHHSRPTTLPSSIDVRDYGAAGDGVREDTGAIQAAVNAAAERGGAVVWLGPGCYLTGPIRLHSHVHLDLDGGAILQAIDNPQTYPLITTRFEGIEQPARIAVISADNCTDLAITGTGVIDGRGKRWWDAWIAAGKKGLPPRPRLIEFRNCRQITLFGVTLRDSPSWTLHAIFCQNVLIDHLTILAPQHAPNTDGIDPDSSSDVTIRNCTIATGDDCIAIKSGKDEEGRKVGKPSHDILIEHCNMTQGYAGVAIGSEMSGGVYNVTMRDCTFSGLLTGLKLKTKRGRGGAIHDLHFSDIQMTDVDVAITFSMYYQAKEKDIKSIEPVGPGTPKIHDITAERITSFTASNDSWAGEVVGLGESWINHIHFSHMRLEAEHSLWFANARDIVLDDVIVKARNDNGPPINPYYNAEIQIK